MSFFLDSTKKDIHRQGIPTGIYDAVSKAIGQMNKKYLLDLTSGQMEKLLFVLADFLCWKTKNCT